MGIHFLSFNLIFLILKFTLRDTGLPKEKVNQKSKSTRLRLISQTRPGGYSDGLLCKIRPLSAQLAAFVWISRVLVLFTALHALKYDHKLGLGQPH